MPKLQARIHNERVKSFCGIANALATATLILALIRPMLDGSERSSSPSEGGLLDALARMVEAGVFVGPGFNIW